MKRLISALSAALLLWNSSALAYSKNSQGLYVDDSGNVISDYWDDHAGIYIVDGVGYDITNSDDDTSNSGVKQNEDGSLEIDSGALPIEDSSSGSSGSGSLTEAEWAARWAKYTAANGTGMGKVAYFAGEDEVYVADLIALGLGRSTISVEGQKILVPTSSLKWETEAPEDKLLALVTPAKQSYITLRAKKSKTSFVMGHCDKCEVLRVINTGKTWTMVEYKRDDLGWVRGYVLTSGLTFYDNSPKSYTAGIITINGKTPKGKDFTVHVRSLNSNKSRQIAEFPTGTPITVFSQDEKWSEIDVEGLHCYILNDFVTLQEPLLIATADTEEEQKEN